MAMDTAMDTVTAMAMDTDMAIRKRKVQFLNQYGKGKEKMMYLFSHYLKIEKYGIEIDLPIPKEYIQRLSK